MSTALFFGITTIAVVAAIASAVLSAGRRGSWTAATIVVAITIVVLWGFTDALAGSGAFARNSLAVQLAAIVSLLFVPLIAVQYLRETLAVAADGEDRPRTARAADEIVVPAEGLRGDHEGQPTASPEVPPTPESRLQAAQANFRDIAESSRACMWIQDAHSGEIIYVSPAFEQIWGCGADALYAAPRRRVEAIHSEDRPRVSEALVQAVAGREFVEEYRVRRPDGSVVWVWDRAVPVRDAAGRVVRLAGIAEDITERKGVEEVNLFRANFVANMSHEVRTPLNIMIGYLEFLIDGTFGELTEQQSEIAERVRKNAEELLDLMSASLDLSRLDNRTIPLAIEAVDVGELVGEVAGDIGKLIENGNVALRSDVGANVPILESDRQKIKMIVKNLLSNAVKFTARGEIVVATRAVDDGVEIAVRDTGVGIAADALPQVFEPFRQGGQSAGEKSGVGLGLYIVRRLVDILEGQIAVESTVGKGTTFRVWLPRMLSAEREVGGEDGFEQGDVV